MATAIVYRSHHGTTLKVAKMLQEKINDEVIDLINIKESKSPNLDQYDWIIIGGSIHAGKLQKDLSQFMKKQQDVLLKKNLGLFLCCMEQNEKATAQLNDAFPENYRNQAIDSMIAGGEFNFEKMNVFEKMIIKKISGISESISNIDSKAIDEFAQKINESMKASLLQ